MGKDMRANKSAAKEYIRSFVYILIAVLLLLIVGSVLSKYVYKNNGQSVLSAHEFYFTSNYLTEDGHEYVLAPNTRGVEIEVNNFEDNLRFSSDEVEYSVSVNGGEPETGSLTAGKKDTDTITLNGFENGKTYEVVATGNSGFEKTVKATFRVLSENAVVYKSVKNTDEYVLLTVWAEALSGDLTVEFPDTVIPDNTDDAMEDVLTQQGTFTDKENFKNKFSSHSYRFFKSNAADVSAGSFSVSLNGVQATVKTPDK